LPHRFQVRDFFTVDPSLSDEAPAVLPTDWSSYATAVLEALGPVSHGKRRPGRQSSNASQDP